MVVAALVVPLFCGMGPQQDGKADSTAAPKTAGAQQTKPPEKTADQVISDAVKAMKQFQTIKADLAEAVRIGTQQFNATGSYAQGPNHQLYMKLVLRPVTQLARPKVDPDSAAAKSTGQPAGKADSPAADDTRNTVLHVCDGQVLWTQWTIEGKTQVERRDVQEILKAVTAPVQDSSNILADIGAGGVPALLTSLRKRMSFQGVRHQEIDGQKFVVVQGRWTDEQMRQFVPPAPPGQQAALPPYIPEYVRVFFEEETLFPRRIMYLKRHPNPEEKTAMPMITLDFTNVVLNGELDDSLFVFKSSGARNETDTTDQFIKALKARQNAQAKPAGR